MKLDRKQKVLITLIIIAVAFLAWQLYDMFFSENNKPASAASTSLQSLTPAPSTVVTTPSSLPSISQTPSTPPSVVMSASTGPAGSTSTMAPSPIMPGAISPSPASPRVIIQQPLQQVTIQAPLTQDQTEYLRLLSKYQVIKMRRLLVDEEAAIASSRVRIAELNNQISKIGGQLPAQASYGMASSGLNIGYQLMYIDSQSGQWTATLNRDGSFEEVKAGMVLPDGTAILRINQNGVVLQQGSRRYLVNFYGTTLLSSSNPPVKRQSLSSVRTAPMPIAVAPTKPQNKPYKLTERAQSLQSPISVLPKQQTTVYAANTISAKPPQHRVLKSDISPPPIKPLVMQTAHIAVPPAKAAVLSKSEMPVVTKNEQGFRIPLQLPQTESPRATQTTPTISPLIQKENKLAATSNLKLTPDQKTKVTQIESSMVKESSNPVNYSNDEKRLLALPSEHYTLQLMGSYRLGDLTRFIQAHRLQNQAYTFHTYYLDKDWYVLVYGAYPSERDAFDAIKTLPPAVQSLKPWVRSFHSIQEAIKGKVK